MKVERSDRNVMKRPLKALLLSGMIFCLKLISSCVNPDYSIYFDFDEVRIVNLDNSADYVMHATDDLMYSSAVAFEVTIAGKDLLAGNSSEINRGKLFAFTAASADSPELQYISSQEITGISVVTLREMSPSIPAGSDVTGLFVCHVPFHYESEFLYIRTDELSAYINPEIYSGEPSITFQLFCSENIQNNSAQFTINVHLSDDRMLYATTSLIDLSPSD